jgi:hypothetical protein
MDRGARLNDIQILSGNGHHGDAARQLLANWRARELEPADLRRIIPELWVSLNPPAGPHGSLSDVEWLELFAATGFFVQGRPVDLGLKECVLFRAAPVERVRGMSWCTHQRMAEGFVLKGDQFGKYRIWSATVPLTAIRAVFHRPSDSFFGLGSDSAREVVIDPDGLPEPVLVG